MKEPSARRAGVLAALLLLLLEYCGVASAQGLSDADQKNVDMQDLTGRLDLSIPQSPAFTLLGVAPEKVIQSDDFRTVALGLLRGLDPNGNLQEGIALDVRPYLLAFGESSTLYDYRKRTAVRLASRTQVSFATASGNDTSDRADRQALGINVKLWMQHDPVMGASDVTPPDTATSEALDVCYKRQLDAAAKLPMTLPPDDELDDEEARIENDARFAATKCLAPFKEQHWNAGSIEVAIAGHRSKVEQMAEDGFGASFGASYGFGQRSQVVFRASYTENMLIPVKDQQGSFDVIDVKDAGVRFRFGSSRGTFMAEGLWTRSRTATFEEEYWRASIGAELMIMKDVWIQLATGKAFSTDRFDDDPVYSGQLRIGFSAKSILAGN